MLMVKHQQNINDVSKNKTLVIVVLVLVIVVDVKMPAVDETAAETAVIWKL